jgi:peptidoglycan/xylan/chitin deacetylase (PgdA/CDA1 family)
MKLSIVISFLLLTAGVVSAADTPAAKIGDTRIAKWQGDKTAAFLLMFDDSWPSHFQVAAPELAKRDMIATFYINPAKGEYLKFAKEWEEKLWKQGQVYGNHTMTHKGVKNLEHAEYEVGECARVIRKITGRENQLVSYGQPGVAKDDWNITAEELKGLLEKHRMIDRPPFAGHGAVYHWQTTEQMLALADKAIASGGMEYLVIHGVERFEPKWGYQDFWALKQEVFLPLLDGLKERRDSGKLWITDHISQHQYETERDSAEVQTLATSGREIKLTLSCKADPKFYDLPLTLVTTVPVEWQQVTVKQGSKQQKIAVKAGKATYEAIPDTTEIFVTKASP